MKIRTHHFAALVATALTLVALPSANATPTIRISVDGGAPVDYVDNGAFDTFNLVPGAISLSLNLGANWHIVVSTGLTKPVLGNAVSPSMDLAYSVTSTGSGTISISFSENGFGPTTGNFLAGIGGTDDPSGTVTYSTSINGTNALFGGAGLTSQSFGAGPFSGSASAAGGNQPGPYSLTQTIFVTHNAAGNSSGDATLKVPEGGFTLTLLGGALIGIAALRKRFIKA